MSKTESNAPHLDSIEAVKQAMLEFAARAGIDPMALPTEEELAELTAEFEKSEHAAELEAEYDRIEAAILELPPASLLPPVVPSVIRFDNGVRLIKQGLAMLGVPEEHWETALAHVGKYIATKPLASDLDRFLFTVAGEWTPEKRGELCRVLDRLGIPKMVDRDGRPNLEALRSRLSRGRKDWAGPAGNAAARFRMWKYTVKQAVTGRSVTRHDSDSDGSTEIPPEGRRYADDVSDGVGRPDRRGRGEEDHQVPLGEDLAKLA